MLHCRSLQNARASSPLHVPRHHCFSPGETFQNIRNASGVLHAPPPPSEFEVSTKMRASSLAALLVTVLSLCHLSGSQGSSVMGLLGGHNEVQDAAQSQKVAAWAAKELISKPEVTAETLELVEVVSHHQQVRPWARPWIVPRPDAQLRPPQHIATCCWCICGRHLRSRAVRAQCGSWSVHATGKPVTDTWPLAIYICCADEQRAQ